MKKKCFKCSEIKSIDEFYVHSQMGDGHLGKCKSCAKKDVHERYYSPEGNEKVKEYERLRFQNPERKKKTLEYNRNRRKKYPKKNTANRKLERAVYSGKIKREPCKVCGNPKSEGHHDDYDKPLEVKWLCLKHHREYHNLAPHNAQNRQGAI